MMLPQEVIRRKRAEGQVAAFAMAVFFNGMSRDEAVA
jgi:thymidine phosphorylase